MSGAWPGHELGRLLVPLVGSRSYAWHPPFPRVRGTQASQATRQVPTLPLQVSLGLSWPVCEMGGGRAGASRTDMLFLSTPHLSQGFELGGVGWGLIWCVKLDNGGACGCESELVAVHRKGVLMDRCFTVYRN